MESLLSNYNEKANFWKLYPTFLAPKILKELHDNDRSKNKTSSSNIMWALSFMFDKTAENPYRFLQKEDRIEVINEDILNNSKFDWEQYKELVEYVKIIYMTEIERTYYSFIEKMEQRRKLIEDSEYTLESADSLDKIIKNTESVRKEVENLEKLVHLQETEGKTKGEIILSATEKGQI